MFHVSTSDPPADGSPDRVPRMAPRAGRSTKTTVRTMGYGSLTVSAWLVAAVAAGHGVAFADDASGSASSSASSSSTASRPGGDVGPRLTLSTRNSDPDDDGDVTNDAGDAATGPGVDDASGADVESKKPTLQELPLQTTVPLDSDSIAPIKKKVRPRATTTIEMRDRFPDSDAGAHDTTQRAAIDSKAVTAPAAPPVARTARVPAPMLTASARLVAGSSATRPAAGVTTQGSTGPTVAIPTAVAASNPIARVAGAVHRFVDALLSAFKASGSSALSGQTPFAWAVLAFVRRTFFNQAPKIGAVNIGQQQADGVITGNVDAIDPDEMGKKVQIRANVFAFPAQPRTPEPDCDCAVVDGFAGLPFMNDAYLGTEPGSNWHAPDAVDITCVYIGSSGAVTYTGKEIGEVTIDGLGTGDVTLDFEGVLLSATQERSVAQLQPHLGTGDLKGVRGTVISESTLDATGAATGVLTGEVVRPEVRYQIVRQPKHGTVSIDAVTGQFAYTPDQAFAELGGDDSFQVVATDGRFNVLNLFRKYNGDPVRTVNLNVASTVAV